MPAPVVHWADGWFPLLGRESVPPPPPISSTPRLEGRVGWPGGRKPASPCCSRAAPGHRLWGEGSGIPGGGDWSRKQFLGTKEDSVLQIVVSPGPGVEGVWEKGGEVRLARPGQQEFPC